jgi:hypothetical protein
LLTTLVPLGPSTCSLSISKDLNGIFLDCSGSNGVDSNCQWDFTTTSTGSSAIILNPTSGPVGTTVTVTGTGFDPNSDVTINFYSTSLGTVTTTSSGVFSVTFTVPLSSSIGNYTVTAT